MPKAPSGSPERSPWKTFVESRAAPAVLAFTLAICLFGYVVSYVVRWHVTQDRFYLTALEEQRVYDRIYEEVLADPALAEAVDPLLGNIVIDRAFLVSTLRLVLPPDRLRSETELVVHEWVRYLRGERGAWRPYVDLRNARYDMVLAISAYVAARLSLATPQEVDSLSEFVEALEPRLLELLEGHVPGVLPAIEPRSLEEADALTSIIFSEAPVAVSEERSRQVSAALLAGDTGAALALAAPVYLDPALREARQAWEARLTGGRALDAVGSVEQLASQRTGAAAERVETIQRVVQLLAVPLGLASAMFGAISLAALFFVLGQQRRSRTRWLGMTLLATAGAGTLLLTLALAAFDAHVNALIRQLPPTFPPSLAQLFADVNGELVAGIRGAALPPLIALGGIGVVLLGVRAALAHAHVPVQLLGRRRWRDGVIAACAAAALIGLGIVEASPLGGPPEGPPLRCNGLRELCDRRVDEVVFAGTHNSMASASLGWVFPHHDHGLVEQLQAGYRALLIDTHHWGTQYVARRLDGALSPEQNAVLAEMLERGEPAKPGAFLCHSFCGLGAIPLEEALARIAGFLRTHPREVVILSIEDYISPAETVQSFESSGLLPLVFRPDEALVEDGEWPTLRELIERDERVIVLADHRGGDPDWYLSFHEFAQDTPADTRHEATFSCRLNRGGENGSLLVMNHWIATLPPDRAWASRVNRREELLEHVEQCRRTRDRTPNVIAVDFYSIGDTTRVVEELNLAPR